MRPVFGGLGAVFRTRLFKVAGITALSFVLSMLLATPAAFSITSLFSSPDQEDFAISDFFTRMADRRPMRQLDRDIVLADIGFAGREEIAEALELLALCGPKTVALDVLFEEPHDDDSRLLAAIENLPSVVLPVGLEQTRPNPGMGEDTPAFAIGSVGFFYAHSKAKAGAANLPGRFDRSTIREFRPAYRLADGRTMLSFPAAVAREADPAAFEALRRRAVRTGNALETVDYASREFTTAPIDRIADSPELFADKIVIVGSFSDIADSHKTPVSATMPGALIHAYALCTILGGRYYDRMPAPVYITLALLLSFCVVWMASGINLRARGLFMRSLQIAIVLLAVWLCYSLFADHRLVVDCSALLLSLTFALFASDIWNGLEYLSERRLPSLRKLKQTNL